MSRVINIGLVLSTVLLAAYAAYLTVGYRTGPDAEWTATTSHYLDSSISWRSQNVTSGWADLELQAAGPEKARVEALRPQVIAEGMRADLKIVGSPRFDVVWKGNGEALVAAEYQLQSNGSTRDVSEHYLLQRSGPQKILVVDVVPDGAAWQDTK